MNLEICANIVLHTRLHKEQYARICIRNKVIQYMPNCKNIPENTYMQNTYYKRVPFAMVGLGSAAYLSPLMHSYAMEAKSEPEILSKFT